MQRAKISIRGIVQGVGFRPFVFNLAMSSGIKGYVSNSSSGVIIDAEGSDLNTFINKVLSAPPALTRIKEFDITSMPPCGYTDFTIKESTDGNGITIIPPDISICNDCLREIFDRTDRRYRYPFTNCTNCGPRYTIATGIPYDRAKTTMASFIMCPDCEAEYHNPRNRRFHAQPNACAVCGPCLEFQISNFKIQIEEKKEPVEAAIELLRKGAIIAIKGIGGFHLCCDASNEDAVCRLRERKRKSNKPFAVMAPDADAVKEFCTADEIEIKTLLSPEKPIVLLEKKKNNLIALSVSPNNRRYGVMLPYTPLHYLLFYYPLSSHFPVLTSNFYALVMTSGNLAEEPIVIDNDAAMERLKDIADAFLLHNRDIYMRADDSVCMVFEGRARFIRRSRGYVPMPVEIRYDSPEILAVGGELKNTFAIIKDRHAILSQHIGDAENHETMEFFQESLRNLKKIYKAEPAVLVHDLHPDYLTTRWAVNSGLKTAAVQHHHAHIVSCMLDNNLDEEVIGVSFDGTGYGSDGRIWGGEFMTADMEKFRREAHFKYIPMPGGDMAVKEPWRMAVSYIMDAFADDSENVLESLGFYQRCGEDRVRNIAAMIKGQVNTHLTSSAGRLFDAVSSIIGLCDRVTFEAEAAIALEAICDEEVFDFYPVNIIDSAPRVVDFSPAVNSIVNDIREGLPKNIIASRFHNTISEVIGRVAERISLTGGLKKVVLSGGVFQNRFLLQRAIINLRDKGLNVYIHERVPANDGGISLGQAGIAAKRLSQNSVKTAVIKYERPQNL
ncbi:MAG: carbamoyltransferase HypF [Nitrospirae bacterium]|nr:carbamoyltransferase HypF [Nitrospirota bacterium]